MQSRFLHSMTQVIPANGTVAFSVSGDFYHIYEATNPILVKPDTGGTAIPHDIRTGVRNIDPFVRLEVTNTTGTPNTVTIIAGFGAIYVDIR